MGCGSASGESTWPSGYMGDLTGEYHDMLPLYGMLPLLSPEEVARFAALREVGWERLRSGDDAGAEAAFHAQIDIFRGNPDPYLSLAFLESGRGRAKQAVVNLRAAVVRGFTDMRQVERAEAWTGMKGNMGFLRLRDAIPTLVEIERNWAPWSSFRTYRKTDDLGEIFREQEDLVTRIEAMAPAIGPRLERLWKRAFDRATASKLEFYVEQHPEAPDLEDALDALMTLYAGGPLLRWGILSAESAGYLSSISQMILESFPKSSMRSGALVATAVSLNIERDRRGNLKPAAAEGIRTALREVLANDAGSPVLATAAVGLIRTEADAGYRDRAAEIYRTFLEDHAEDREVLERVRGDLGIWSLLLGGLPAFKATSLGGQTVERDSIGGKVTVIDFWATWCRPCIEEFPTLRRISKRHGDQVALVGVNLDWAEDCTVKDLRNWIAQQDLPGMHLHDGLAWDSELVSLFGVREIPFNVVVASDGTVLAVNEYGRKLEKVVRGAVRDGMDVPGPVSLLHAVE